MTKAIAYASLVVIPDWKRSTAVHGINDLCSIYWCDPNFGEAEILTRPTNVHLSNILDELGESGWIMCAAYPSSHENMETVVYHFRKDTISNRR